MNVKKTVPGAKLPSRAHSDDAGLDLYCIDEINLQPGERVIVDLGLIFEFPHNVVALIAGRSGLSSKGLMVLGGIVDSGYRGSLKVNLWNTTNQQIILLANSKIAQLILLPVLLPVLVEVNELDVETHRGSNGFGSTDSGRAADS